MNKTIISSLLLAVILLCLDSALAVKPGTKGSGFKGKSLSDATFESSGSSVTLLWSLKDIIMPPAYGDIVADTSVSQGAFAGNYVDTGVNYVDLDIKGLTFKIKCNTPGLLNACAARVVLKGASGWYWYTTEVQVSKVYGEWVTNSISFDPDLTNWRSDRGSDWIGDLMSVSEIGVRLIQNGDEAQSYTIDDFMLIAPELSDKMLGYFKGLYGITSLDELTDEQKNLDSDGDGMADWLEFWAGMDPGNRSSLFKAKMKKDKQKFGEYITVEWTTVKGGSYDVKRAIGSSFDFVTIVSNIVAPDASGEMEYRDYGANGDGPYFYKVISRVPGQ